MVDSEYIGPNCKGNPHIVMGLSDHTVRRHFSNIIILKDIYLTSNDNIKLCNYRTYLCGKNIDDQVKKVLIKNIFHLIYQKLSIDL